MAVLVVIAAVVAIVLGPKLLARMQPGRPPAPQGGAGPAAVDTDAMIEAEAKRLEATIIARIKAMDSLRTRSELMKRVMEEMNAGPKDGA